MPDHVHLLLSETEQETLADALKSLKQGVARRLIGNAEHFWQKRYHDFNVRNNPQFIEKLRYIHRNPVKAGLCERPEDWPWSSFVTTRRVARAGLRLSRSGPLVNASGLLGDCVPQYCPTQAKSGLEWATRPVLACATRDTSRHSHPIAESSP
jgi:hypothetical protein